MYEPGAGGVMPCRRVRVGTVLEATVWRLAEPAQLAGLAPTADVHLPTERALPMVLRLFDRWGLTLSEQAALLGVTPATVGRYRRGRLPGRARTCQRLGLLLRIHLLLGLLYPGRALRYSWVRRANAAFGGRRPLDVMTTEGLKPVHRYLHGLSQR